MAVPEALSVDVLTPENSTNSHLRFWRTYVVLRAQLFRHILDSTRLYGDACVSRPYTNSQDDQLATQVLVHLGSPWNAALTFKKKSGRLPPRKKSSAHSKFQADSSY